MTSPNSQIVLGIGANVDIIPAYTLAGSKQFPSATMEMEFFGGIPACSDPNHQTKTTHPWLFTLADLETDCYFNNKWVLVLLYESEPSLVGFLVAQDQVYLMNYDTIEQQWLREQLWHPE